MVDAQKVKEWVKHRIDYWEDELEKNDPKNTIEDIIEYRAMLAAFYMVTEFIDGQQR
jgi:hypothetical protein